MDTIQKITGKTVQDIKEYVKLIRCLYKASMRIVASLKDKKVEPVGLMDIQFIHRITEDKGPVSYTKISTISMNLDHISDDTIDVKESEHIIEIFKDSIEEPTEKTYYETFITKY